MKNYHISRKLLFKVDQANAMIHRLAQLLDSITEQIRSTEIQTQTRTQTSSRHAELEVLEDAIKRAGLKKKRGRPSLDLQLPLDDEINEIKIKPPKPPTY